MTGERLARFHFDVGLPLHAELVAAGLVPSSASRDEWECLALHACLRGLVAASGFNIETAQAVDAFHAAVREEWVREHGEAEAAARSARAAERYREYGVLGQEGGAKGAATAPARIGAAAARHLTGGEPDSGLVELVAHLHESIAEGAAEMLRTDG
jgi:hypothetical protein